jgi:hypothetical protein
MYLAPTLERYGTFRELTRLGTNNVSDGCTVSGIGGTADGNEVFTEETFPPTLEPICISA